MNCLSSKQAFRGWLVAFVAVLTLACAARFGCGLCWLQSVGGVDLQASQSFESYLMGYQVGGEGQDGLTVLADFETLAVQLERSFLEPAPDDELAAYGFFRGANGGQAGALVLKVRDERDFYFTVLVAQDHSIYLALPNFQCLPFSPCGVVVAEKGFASADPSRFRGRFRMEVFARYAFAVGCVDKPFQTVSALRAFSVGPEQSWHGAIVAQQHTPRKTRAALSGSSTTAEHIQPTKRGVIA